MNNNEMLEAYLFEANTLLEELDEILINCEKNNHFDTDSINTIFRIMHTIKGSSAMMEFDSIMTVSHKMEDLFAYVRENGLDSAHYTELFDLMFRCGDFLKEEMDHVQKNMPLSNNIGTFTEEINGFLKKIFSASQSVVETATAEEIRPAVLPAAVSAEAPSKATASNETAPAKCRTIHVFFDEDAQMENLRAFMLMNSLDEICSNIQYMPEHPQNCPAEELAKSGFRIQFASAADLELCADKLSQFVFIKTINYLTDSPAEQTRASDTDIPAATSESTAGTPTASGITVPSSASLINVNLTKLDKLMDLMGEIVITESMVTSIPTADGVDIDNFAKAARQLQKLTDELQENVMAIRMIPVSSVFNKMHRIVRDMSKKLNKDVDLQLVGEETEVDKSVVDSIADPIMHVVRNAMDHGIETIDERIAKGKPAKGTITLTAKNTGGEILVTVQDDGKGFDRDAILIKAKERGFLRKPEQEYSDKEVFAFLMMAGFSTKQQVTEFSGRGVGMDVVKKNIEKVSGEVTLSSEKDKGSVVQFKIPLTLAIINGMEIAVGNSLFTIPINNIRQSFKVEPEQILHDTQMREIIMIRDTCYPLIRLHKTYDIETPITELTDGILILVENNDLSYCIFADALVGEHQVVIKPLPGYLNKFGVKEHGISGCAILGDGSISLILDILNLAS